MPHLKKGMLTVYWGKYTSTWKKMPSGPEQMTSGVTVLQVTCLFNRYLRTRVPVPFSEMAIRGCFVQPVTWVRTEGAGFPEQLRDLGLLGGGKCGLPGQSWFPILLFHYFHKLPFEKCATTRSLP